MARPFSYETAAAVLVDALVRGDRKAAAHWGVSERSIRGWRARMARDEVLAHSFQQKGQQVRAAVGEKLELAVVSAIDALADLVREATPGEGTIHEVAGALRILVEAQLGMEVIRARTGRVHRAA